MSVYLFPLYSLTHFLIFIWCLRLARADRAPGALLVAMIAAGLVYDNGIVALGTSIGAGPILEALSWPRFAMHALLTPFMMIAVTRMAVAGSIRWAATPAWTIVVWVLVIGGIIEGTFAHLIGLQLEPACFNGVLRYTGNLNPAQFCFDGQVAGEGGGPPIPSIVGNFVTLIVGFALWRRNDWSWLMAGALCMFVAAAIPNSGFGLAPGNGGEVILLIAYAATVARFGRGQPAR
jgi:hypothetical protein